MTGVLKDTGCQPQSHGQADPGGGLCPRCSRPRCSAAAKTRPGERCRKNPHPGATICTNHGLTEVGRAKAAEVVQAAAADREIRKVWVGLDQAVPVTDPVEALARLTGALQEMADRVGEKVNEITHLAAGDSMSQLRGEVVLLERILSQLGRHLDAMARLGIAERQAKFQQEQAEAITAAYRLGLAAVPSNLLTPADLELMAAAFMAALGYVETAQLEGGAA